MNAESYFLGILLSTSVLLNVLMLTLISRSSKRDARKEKLIERLHQKVLEYRKMVHDMNAIARAERADDDLV